MATFKLIRPDKVSVGPDQDKAFLWFLAITIAVCAIVVWLKFIWVILPLPISALLIKFVGFPRRALPDWPRAKDVIGELAVDLDSLTLAEEGTTLPFQNIQSAIFEHNHIKGEPLFYRDIHHNGIASLHMTFRDGHERTIKFLIERRDQVPDVEFLLRSMYKRGARVEEFVGRHRMKTILFKHGRSFKEIQALKEELGVDGFY
jgi:hypothetical protein